MSLHKFPFGDFKEEAWLSDTVCAICDNGGEVLCCEGSCLRSFHATKDSGVETNCCSLGYSEDQVEAMPNFFCLNCKYKQHQCFACGKLGSSGKHAISEVFRCRNETCGHFYHPKCVARLLSDENEAESTNIQRKISSGEPFTCPAHKCVACKQGENKQIWQLHFAMCRRCPVSYHRRCLPMDISFQYSEANPPRAWDNLLPNRILMYCMKHGLDPFLRTPLRNHIIFPNTADKEKTALLSKSKPKIFCNSKLVSDMVPFEHGQLKLKMKIPHPKQNKHLGISDKSCTTHMIYPKKAEPEETISSAHPVKGSSIVKPMKRMDYLSPDHSLRKFKSSFPVVDGETTERIKNLVSEVSSSLTMDDITKKLSRPSTHSYQVREIDKGITEEKVVTSIEAIKIALKKLEEGNTVVDVTSVFKPEILYQIIKWRKRLKTYLAPFLHGMRYTSFGRHFTKVDKLIEIADKLQWYILSGDTIVDFCCGANDFSRVMREKLDAAGKECSFRNYDLILPRNDLNFEQRDWMTVQPDELPDGSRLIMGLNPPFGEKAYLANTFIDKALSFQPKMLILIVPEETERLDKKKSPYDLIWEDNSKFSGKSFYLPGSIDMDGNQMEQWNLKPPPLYLWSRPDWTLKHRNIAFQKGHILKENAFHTEANQYNTLQHDTYERDNGDENTILVGNALRRVVHTQKKLKITQDLPTNNEAKCSQMINLSHLSPEPEDVLPNLTSHLGGHPKFENDANYENSWDPGSGLGIMLSRVNVKADLGFNSSSTPPLGDQMYDAGFDHAQFSDDFLPAASFAWNFRPPFPGQR